MLPLYKHTKQHIKSHLAQAWKDFGLHRLHDALQNGLQKLEKHMETTLKSDYPLLGAILHPALQLSYFKDTTLWPAVLGLPSRARVLLEHLHLTYNVKTSSNTLSIHKNTSALPASPSKQSPFMATIKTHGTSNCTTQSEVNVYLSGLYPYAEVDDNPLAWWKVSFSC
ncbi:hypothetical protein PAXRUDRAFT_165740 [Paxillus rubicundulus Ve08.2h10]|uniref:Uncharacterized protein n=1 Tax=Paxillus rubicundulus Ve08.2h10 TaxID=930991 RepID=A0A0D0D2N5_9AGAM|nr:hypothetical protein PAXRUDRAFT_165740 [Paxillus rubicundulus Ve08.2h10]